MVPAWRNSLGVSAHQCQAGQPSPRGASVASTDSAAFHGVYSSVRNAENIGELELKGRAFLYSGLHLWIFNFRVLLMVTVICLTPFGEFLDPKAVGAESTCSPSCLCLKTKQLFIGI